MLKSRPQSFFETAKVCGGWRTLFCEMIEGQVTIIYIVCTCTSTRGKRLPTKLPQATKQIQNFNISWKEGREDKIKVIFGFVAKFPVDKDTDWMTSNALFITKVQKYVKRTSHNFLDFGVAHSTQLYVYSGLLVSEGRHDETTTMRNDAVNNDDDAFLRFSWLPLTLLLF